jgi:hypothetical protein
MVPESAILGVRGTRAEVADISSNAAVLVSARTATHCSNRDLPTAIDCAPLICWSGLYPRRLAGMTSGGRGRSSAVPGAWGAWALAKADGRADLGLPGVPWCRCVDKAEQT